MWLIRLEHLLELKVVYVGDTLRYKTAGGEEHFAIITADGWLDVCKDQKYPHVLSWCLSKVPKTIASFSTVRC